MNYKIYSDGKEVSGNLPFDLFQTEAVGIFESMRAVRGRILHEEDHLARLLDSAKTVGYRPFPVPAKLRGELQSALKAFGEKECYVRLTLWEGRTFVIMGVRKHAPELYEKGVAIKTASFPRGGPGTFPWQAKASAYQQAVLASTEPNPLKAYEWIFLDREGSLTETRIGNFFIVKYPAKAGSLQKQSLGLGKGEAELWTPPEHLILNGVTRRFVIKCAFGFGFRVREVPLTRHEFFNADEAFLCNTSWEILPVRTLDGRVIGAGKPGPVTLKLHRYFKRRVQEDVASHRSPSTHQRFR